VSTLTIFMKQTTYLATLPLALTKTGDLAEQAKMAK
jgi:hypothetical protein